MSNTQQSLEQKIAEQIALYESAIKLMEIELVKLAPQRVGCDQYCVCDSCNIGNLLSHLITKYTHELAEWRKPLPADED